MQHPLPTCAKQIMPFAPSMQKMLLSYSGQRSSNFLSRVVRHDFIFVLFSLLLCFRVIFHNAIHAPVALLCTLQHLAALFGQLWLTTVARNLRKEDRAPCGAGAFTLARLLALAFFEDLLDGRRLGKLFCMDGFGNLTPQLQRLVLELLLVWWE